MRWDYGKVYQEIRKSKGLTQEEICGDFLARSTLARIESGKVVPKFETMIFLLHQIDMTFEEFKYICNLYHPSPRQEILNTIHNHTSIIGTNKLEELRKKCEKHLAKTHDIPIKHILYSLNIVIPLRKNGLTNTDENFHLYTKKIWSYLEKQDTWYENDFRLLATILYHFPISTLSKIKTKILECLEKYNNYPSITSLQLTLLTNLSTIYLYHELKLDCEHITLIILDLSKKVKRYDSLGFAQVRLGICRGDGNLIERGLTLLRLTEENEMVAMLEEEVKTYR